MKTSSLQVLPSSARHRRFVAVVLALAAALALALATPSLATEGGQGAQGGEAEASGKITMPSNPHDQFGLVLFGLMGVGAAAAGINALMQLRGRRPQADGKIRWR